MGIQQNINLPIINVESPQQKQENNQLNSDQKQNQDKSPFVLIATDSSKNLSDNESFSSVKDPSQLHQKNLKQQSISHKKQSQMILEKMDKLKTILSKGQKSYEEALYLQQYFMHYSFFEKYVGNLEKDKQLEFFGRLQLEYKQANKTIFEKGDRGKKMYFIIQGQVGVLITLDKRKRRPSIMTNLTINNLQNKEEKKQNENEQDKMKASKEKRKYNKQHTNNENFLDYIENKYSDQRLECIIKQGDVFGEIALQHRVKRTATIVTEQECYFAVIGYESYQHFLKKSYSLYAKQKIECWSDEGIEIMFSKIFKEVKFQRNECIYKIGDLSKYIYVVLEGEVKVTIEKQELSDNQKLDMERKNQYEYKNLPIEDQNDIDLLDNLDIIKKQDKKSHSLYFNPKKKEFIDLFTIGPRQNFGETEIIDDYLKQTEINPKYKPGTDFPIRKHQVVSLSEVKLLRISREKFITSLKLYSRQYNLGQIKKLQELGFDHMIKNRDFLNKFYQNKEKEYRHKQGIKQIIQNELISQENLQDFQPEHKKLSEIEIGKRQCNIIAKRESKSTRIKRLEYQLSFNSEKEQIKNKFKNQIQQTKQNLISFENPIKLYSWDNAVVHQIATKINQNQKQYEKAGKFLQKSQIQEMKNSGINNIINSQTQLTVQNNKESDALQEFLNMSKSIREQKRAAIAKQKQNKQILEQTMSKNNLNNEINNKNIFSDNLNDIKSQIEHQSSKNYLSPSQNYKKSQHYIISSEISQNYVKSPQENQQNKIQCFSSKKQEKQQLLQQKLLNQNQDNLDIAISQFQKFNHQNFHKDEDNKNKMK
ncbi:Cyclic nucleotide-binding protein [Pseudocohnilembus persalinus]|uniref:Cyclic nucleotide-binding protein n=1 Tax=Pseudocohnilembus persalinus TaxID=266149 RepID=A0A0V0R4L2_PSEPJ|nr:Cyclic nucleotide-binding protein [Pseudocohnilembus persalinus]|eukprot:KRX09296.1 Cyclic nucleotide-binding protein [Pseudocohnilembus persalinus]